MSETLWERVLSCLDVNGLVDMTRELVRIRSVFDPETEGANEEKVARFLASRLEEWGFSVVMEEVSPGRPNVIATIAGNEPGKTILFEGHTDVVTEGDPDEWEVDPFGGELKEGRIYGRGACDTKGNLAAMIFAAKALKDSRVPFKGRVMLCIPVDEEGMMEGIKHFIRRGWADSVDAAVICEPQENRICISQKGALRAILETEGKMAHGAMPFSGVNPNWAMAEFICALREVAEKEVRIHGEDEYLGLPSITPTMVHSPSSGRGQLNVIPRQSLVGLDIRTIPAQDHQALKEALLSLKEEIARKDGKVKMSLEFIEERPCTKTEKNEQIVHAASTAYQVVTGKHPVYDGVPGATDGTFLYAWKGIPLVTTGAGKRDVPHQANEYVDIDELVEAARIFATTAVVYLSEKAEWSCNG